MQGFTDVGSTIPKFLHESTIYSLYKMHIDYLSNNVPHFH